MNKKINLLTMFLFFCFAWGSTSFSKGLPKEGLKFPDLKVQFFQVSPPKKFRMHAFDFSTIVRKKTVLMVYFLPNHSASETELKAVLAVSKLFQGKLEIIGITRGRTLKEIKTAYARMEELGIQIPVLVDEKGLMAYVTMTRQVPSYTLLDNKGFIKMINASSLTEKISPKLTTMSFLKKAMDGEEVNFTRAMGYSPNIYDTIGKKAVDIVSTEALGQKTFQLSVEVAKENKPILLVFWSITCPHCQKFVPLMNQYFAKNRDKFRMVTLVEVDKKDKKEELKEFAKKNNLSCEILNDEKGVHSNNYKVMMVPTLYLIDNQGIVVSAKMGGGKDMESLMNSMLVHVKKQAPTSKKQVTKTK